MKTEKNGLKKYRESQKRVHNEEVSAIVNETYNSHDQKVKEFYYNEQKKLKWWGWLTSLLFSVLGTGLSFLIGWALYNNENVNNTGQGWGGVGWTAFAIMVIYFFSYMVLSWIRNREAAKFFNHKGRRYQRTLTDWEAKIIVWKKIFFLAALVMVLVTGLTIGLL